MDVIIVGTGASALLLGQSLLRRRVCDRLRFVGPKRALRAHVLSYWSADPTPFDPYVRRTWDHVSVVDRAGVETVTALARFRYRTFTAQSWADDTFAEIMAVNDVSHVEGIVSHLVERDGAAEVIVDGQRLTADWVFASGGPGSPTPSVWQRFAGWEVECDSHTLRSDAARLLDFGASDGTFQFGYALPLGSHRLFVEHVSYARCDHERHLDELLRRIAGSYRVIDREQGCTPLFATPPDRGGHRIIRIGVGAGLAKPCTGYAVMRLWRDAERIAISLRRLGHPYGEERMPSLYQLADEMFMTMIRAEPTALHYLLTQLVSKASGDAVLGFLDECATWREQLAVARAVPGLMRWLALGPREV